MKITIAFSGLLMLAVTLFVNADCMNSDTLAELESCAYKELIAAQLKIETEYMKARIRAKEMDDFEQGKFKVELSLRKAQQLWQQYHQKHCENVRATFAEGAEANLQYLTCLTQLTNERIEQLRTVYATH